MPDYRKKLIEVALPLEAINAASAREQNNPFLRGHPRSLHQWWARRPLAACRAVLFASLVDDPSSRPEEFPTEADQDAERQRLFRLIEELVKWENSNNPDVLDAARKEILKSTDGHPPPVLDPFCGRGSIPLEAQRLGLEAHGSDLNPVAVLITRALIEIPPKFAGRPPVNPESRRTAAHSGAWPGATGLAEDVRYYGRWMRDEAERRIGHLYPKAKLPPEHGGGEATVIAWLWARTVKCPNPACGATRPLVRSFTLSARAGRHAWVEPVVDRDARSARFTVKTGTGVPPDGTMQNRSARCLVCNAQAALPYIREEAQAGRMGSVPLAMVAEGQRQRVYLPPDPGHERVARSARAAWKLEQKVTTPSHDVDRLPMYGMYTWGDAFTPRQLAALTTLCDLVGEARDQARADAVAAAPADNGVPLNCGGTGAAAYADAVATYLAFGVDKAADYGNSLCTWNTTNENVSHLFTKQAIPMVWDYAESNLILGPLAFDRIVHAMMQPLDQLCSLASGSSRQSDIASSNERYERCLISTDPPYYDNMSYADISDFFYVWLRRSLAPVYPDLFSTLVTPKAQELIASPYRFEGDRNAANRFFEVGLGRAFMRICGAADPNYPVTVYYAFKQSGSDDCVKSDTAGVVSSTGWEVMLAGLIRSGFQITGTWPVRTERLARSVGIGTNALASSIVLVCRPRPSDAPTATRREFLTALRRELPEALILLMHGNVAPVDLAQASIGPGMAVYSRYAQVLEPDGSRLAVRTALQIINQELDAVLAAQEGATDADTRFCVAWFEQFGMSDAPYGDAETLSKAKNTAVSGLVEAGVLEAKAGRVRLLRRDEYPEAWDPSADGRVPVWECAQQLVRALDRGGESGAADLLRRLGGERGEAAKELAYRLFAICERKGWAQEAIPYNSLVVSWPEIARLAAAGRTGGQLGLL